MERACYFEKTENLFLPDKATFYLHLNQPESPLSADQRKDFSLQMRNSRKVSQKILDHNGELAPAFQ